MKKLLFPLLFLLFTGTLKSQTVFWTETFSSGSAARATLAHNYPADVSGNWTQTDIGTQGGSANQWYVSGEECGNAPNTCGSACPNVDASLHISAIGGLCGTPDCGAAYDASGPANVTQRRIESPVISTLTLSNIRLDFAYIAAQANAPNDQVKVVYSCNGGTTWQDLPGASPLAPTLCCDCNIPAICAGFGLCCGLPKVCSGLDQGRWTAISLAMPVCAANNANFRFGFEWQNNGDGIGTDPSIAIDEIALSHAILLPVKFTYVAAKAIGNEVQLAWEMEEQSFVGEFLIERSNGGAFEVIAQKKDKERSTFLHQDQVYSSGIWYYRVVHLSREGTRTLSPIQQVWVDAKAGIHVFPNPTTETLYVSASPDHASPIQLSLINPLGQTIYTEKLAASSLANHPIEMGKFPTGIYLLVVETEESSQLEKVIKQ